MRHGVFVEGHSESFGCFELLIVKNLARSSSNDMFGAIQVSQLNCDSG